MFIDRNNKYYSSKDAAYSRDVVKLTAFPWGVCYVKDNMVAVTFDYEVVTNKIAKYVKVSNMSYGIDSNGEIIVLSLSHVDFEAFCTMDLDGNIMCRVKIQSELSTCISLFSNIFIMRT